MRGRRGARFNRAPAAVKRDSMKDIVSKAALSGVQVGFNVYLMLVGVVVMRT